MDFLTDNLGLDHAPVVEVSDQGADEVQALIFERLEEVLPSALSRFRWFGSKSKDIERAKILESIALACASGQAHLMFFEIQYKDGSSDVYAMPVRVLSGQAASEFANGHKKEVFLRLDCGQGKFAIVCDATYDEDFCRSLFATLLKTKTLPGKNGDVVASLTKDFENLDRQLEGVDLEPHLIKGEQSNTSVSFGGRYIFKLFRRLEEGLNLDAEIGRFLTEETGFKNTPDVVAMLEYHPKTGETVALGSLRVFVENQGDAWNVFLERLKVFVEKLQSKSFQKKLPQGLEQVLLSSEFQPMEVFGHPVPEGVREALAPFAKMAYLLGQRTMEMHIALASKPDDLDFAPEDFSPEDRLRLAEVMKRQGEVTFSAMRKYREKGLLGEDVDLLLSMEDKVKGRFDRFTEGALEAKRTRIHGDYHLGQVLFNEEDFWIIDFEGEPARSISERKIKRSPLRDVAGMLRSFHYASHVILSEMDISDEESKGLVPWLAAWNKWVCVFYLEGYFSLKDQAGFLPKDRNTAEMLLDLYILEKALYELMYEMDNRPEWVRVPLSGILDLLK